MGKQIIAPEVIGDPYRHQKPSLMPEAGFDLLQAVQIDTRQAGWISA